MHDSVMCLPTMAKISSCVQISSATASKVKILGSEEDYVSSRRGEKRGAGLVCLLCQESHCFRVRWRILMPPRVHLSPRGA